MEREFARLCEGKSVGPDKVPPVLLKRCKENLEGILRNIFNKSLESWVVPEEWRCGNIVPIYKKGCKTDPSNYRPISLTCVVCKMLEHIICNRVLKYLEEETGGIDDGQHGFRKGKSTTTNLLEFYTGVILELEAGRPVDIVFLDFYRAFDRVSHAILIGKLVSLGVPRYLVRWLTNYLKNRVQRVGFNGIFSDWLPVESWVPQGSVVGPLLFLVFINDLPMSVGVPMNMFADDAKLLCSPDTSEVVLKAIRNVEDWSALNELPLSISKCKVLHCGGSLNPRVDYIMQGVKLDSGDSERDLGVCGW